MLPYASAIAAAELSVDQSRAELRSGLRSLGNRVSRPSFLAVAVAAGALLGFSLKRSRRSGALAGILASALIRRLIARAGPSPRA